MEPSMDVQRIQLERVSKVPNEDYRVMVQFLIMNDYNQVKSPNDIIMQFKDRYGNGDNDYTKQYQLSNVVFGDPSVIINDTEIKDFNTFEKEKQQAQSVDNSTLANLENKYNRVSYYGCDITLADLAKNLISADTPLFTECNPVLDQHFKGLL